VAHPPLMHARASVRIRLEKHKERERGFCDFTIKLIFLSAFSAPLREKMKISLTPAPLQVARAAEKEEGVKIP
jgi:hypothetical protein